MADHFEDGCRAPAADLAVDTLAEIKGAAPELPPPALVAYAMVPKGLTGKGGVGQRGGADKAAGCVRVKTEEERNEEMVSIPESLIGLLPYLCMGGGEHQ